MTTSRPLLVGARRRRRRARRLRRPTTMTTSPPQLTPAQPAPAPSCAALPLASAYATPPSPRPARSRPAADGRRAAGRPRIAGSPADVPAHQPGRRQALRDRLRDAPAAGLERPLLLPGQRRHRRQRRRRPPASSTAGGPGSTHALAKGFAVISSDAGHGAAQNGRLRPRSAGAARLRLPGRRQALTPMAKAAIRAAYGKAPDRSYIGGCSNGGRHAMVAAARYARRLRRLPRRQPGHRAAARRDRQHRRRPDLRERSPPIPADVSTRLHARRAQAGLERGPRSAATRSTARPTAWCRTRSACQAAFDLGRDVPTCTGARDGSCLAAAQKTAIGRLFAGVDHEHRANGSTRPSRTTPASPRATGRTGSSPRRRLLDAGAVAHIWQVPPAPPTGFNGPRLRAHGNVDALLARVQATDRQLLRAGAFVHDCRRTRPICRR